MSIYSYVGLPRSGKSYNVVANVIVPALRSGRRVVTNVPVYRDKILALDGVNPAAELINFPVSEVAQDPELIRKYVKNGDVFVLDEVWRLWPSGQKTNDIPEVYKSLLAEHGHMVDEKGQAMHIVLVVQDLTNIATFARKLVEQTFIHTKLGHMGLEGRFRVDIYQGCVTGVVGPEGRRIREIYGSYVPEIWDLYKSHTLSESKLGGGANEKSVDRRGNVLKKPFFVIGIPLALIAGIFAVWRLKSEGDRMMHLPDKEKASAVHPGFVDSVHVPANSGVLGSVAGQIRSRPRFRVLGYIEVPGSPERSKAILIGDAGKTIFRSMTHCRFIDKDYFECNVDGEWFGSVGESLAEHEAGAVPVTVPKDTPGNLPIAGGGDAPTSVARGAPAAATMESLPEHHLPPVSMGAGRASLVRPAHGGS